MQAVRSLVKSHHAVCFGLGDGNDHLIINKLTLEINRMRDDDTNYLQDLIIVPQEQLSQVAAELSQLQQKKADEDGGWKNNEDFGRQGR